MKEYIERRKAKQILADDYAYSAANLLDTVPTSDVQEVRHGKWERADTERGTYIRCSECLFDGLGAGSSYCPHCGTKMDKESD